MRRTLLALFLLGCAPSTVDLDPTWRLPDTTEEGHKVEIQLVDSIDAAVHASMPVRVDGVVKSTDATGHVAFEHVRSPYQAVVVADEEILVLDGACASSLRVPVRRGATSEGTVCIAPHPTRERVVYAVASNNSRGGAAAARGAPGQEACARVSWGGVSGELLTVAAFELEGESYVGLIHGTLRVQPGGRGHLDERAFARVGTTTGYFGVTLPPGWALDGEPRLVLDGAALPIGVAPMGDRYRVLLPSEPRTGKVLVTARGPGGAQSYAVGGASQMVEVPEPPAPVGPDDGITDVTTATQLLPSRARSLCAIELRGPGRPIRLITDSRAVPIPDLTSLGLELPRRARFTWTVERLSGSVDDALLRPSGSLRRASAPRSFVTAP